MNTKVLSVETIAKKTYNVAGLVADVAILSALGTAFALASTAGGPFGDIENFVTTNFLPAIGAIGVAGGIGYGSIHMFKHDYGRGILGFGTSVAGGFAVAQSSWFSSKAGVSAATIGGHLSAVSSFIHLLGF